MVLTNGLASEIYQINRFDSPRFHLAGAIESRCRFNSDNGATYQRHSWSPNQRPTMELTKEVIGFPSSPHLPPLQKSSCRKWWFATAILMVGWLEIWRATTTKRIAQNKLMMRLSAQGLNLGSHTSQEAHDATWFGAQGSNTGPGLVTPGDAPLGHSGCR